MGNPVALRNNISFTLRSRLPPNVNVFHLACCVLGVVCSLLLYGVLQVIRSFVFCMADDVLPVSFIPCQPSMVPGQWSEPA